MEEKISVDLSDLNQLVTTLDRYMDLAWENSDDGKNWDDEVKNDFEFDDEFLAEMREKYNL